jgi:glutamate-1-semialdehyde aminotransferase
LIVKRNQAEAPFDEALKYIPGGVSIPVRAFRVVGL